MVRTASARDVPSVAVPGEEFGADDLVGLGEVLGVPEPELGARIDRWLPGLDHLPFDGGRLGELGRVIQCRRSSTTR